MVKTSKRGTAKPPKSITEFFTRKSITTTNSSELSQVTSTDQSKQVLAEQGTTTHTILPAAHTIHTDSHLPTTTTVKTVTTGSDASNQSLRAKPRIFLEAVEIVSPRKKALSNRSYTPNPSVVSFDSMLNIKDPAPRSKSTSLVRRKTKFDSDSDAEKLDSIVYISKSPLPPRSTTSTRTLTPLRPKENLSLTSQPSARKKPRLSSPDPGLKSILGDVIPSSQSDEQEMMIMRLPQRDPALIKKHVDEWRQMAILPTPTMEMNAFPEEMRMDIDPGPSSPLSSPGSFRSLREGNPESRDSTIPVTPIFDREDTPPQLARNSSYSPLPPSPVALDPETKTAMIIAKIREKAYADNMSSPLDSPTIEFKEELDDSSDDEGIVLWSPTKGKGKPMNPIMAPQPSPINNRRSKRLSTPNLEPSPSPPDKHPSMSSRRSRIVPTRGPVILTHNTSIKKGKGKVFNPLDALLKEKELADKRGKGDAAFRLAEGAIAGKDAVMDETNLEGDFADWSNEDAARMAVDERSRIDMKPLSPVASSNRDGDEIILTPQDPERLLGEKHGKAVADILDSDRDKKQVEQEREKVHGVPLWSDLNIDDGMAVDHIFPILMSTENHSLVCYLNTLIKGLDFTEAILLLDSGALTSINLTEYPSIIPYLCTLALSSYQTSVNRSAFRLLSYIWDTTTEAVPGLSFDTVLTTLVKLGAKLPILSNFAWVVEPHMRPDLIGVQQRDEILYHLVGLIASSARARRLLTGQAPDMIMAMLIIAHDPMTSPQLYQEIVLTIDEVCRFMAPGDEISKSLEATICTKILRYATEQTPVNKAFIMNILAAGTGRTRRIARWTAHALVTRSTLVSSASYCDLPPLLPILDQLRCVTDRDSGESPGMFELHEKTDYIDLCFHVQVLGVAVSKVRAYVEQERITRRATPFNLKNAEESPDMMIQMIHQAIEKRHSSISDVRAAHLDRSRAKAALKELSMRIHYQILSTRGGGTGTGKPRNLRQYFDTKN
ncbi:hypothetical protein BDZ94DRAFT_1261462 [Collybia nuda]|uniref:Uncharacterized protein n=1 Tax=Collybia nuda TaxID=64659 RepID=A0A9P5Y594_9AGAR|nr:hypothetical protein BDZ94DRAFT_1261462 [Collybia nuda]